MAIQTEQDWLTPTLESSHPDGLWFAKSLFEPQSVAVYGGLFLSPDGYWYMISQVPEVCKDDEGAKAGYVFAYQWPGD